MESRFVLSIYQISIVDPDARSPMSILLHLWTSSFSRLLSFGTRDFPELCGKWISIYSDFSELLTTSFPNVARGQEEIGMG